jgi:predicted RNA-binding Zn ribbon-like protein
MAPRNFELLGGALCLDFVNTIHEYGAADPREELHRFQDLISFEYQAGAITEREAAKLSSRAAKNPSMGNKTLTAAKEFRRLLYRSFSAIAHRKDPSSADLAYFNRVLPRMLQNLRVQRKGHEVVWVWKKDHRNLDPVLWPIVRSAAELLTSDERVLVRECKGEDCTWLFLDKSKNQTRRWCDMKVCGNRAKWHRYHNRHKKKKGTILEKRILSS